MTYRFPAVLCSRVSFRLSVRLVVSRVILRGSTSYCFSHCPTALFLHDLTDREPLAYTVTVKSGYNPHRLKGDGVKVYRIKAELHGLGLSQTNTPFGNPVAVYDLERTVCDVVRSRSGMDVQVLRDTLRRYAGRRDRDLRRLMHYAGAFHVENILRQYLEVLL